MLERLLRNLAAQDCGGMFEMSVVVVDNDASGSARETVDRVGAQVSLSITYEIETERTIPAVRNHALRLATGNYIGIIDDDEFPPAHWLLEAYRGIQTFQVDGVLGPVFPFFEQPPPPWLLKAGLCELPVERTGTLLRWNQTRTGNVLLKRDVFDRHGLQFDEQFKTGGSDQEFFRQAMARGCRFVAVEEAPVYEVVPPARWTAGYWIRRALVNGYNSRKYRQGGGQKFFREALNSAKSACAIVVYAIALPVCALVGKHVLVNCLEKGAHHLSSLCALAGIELWPKRDF